MKSHKVPNNQHKKRLARKQHRRLTQSLANDEMAQIKHDQEYRYRKMLTAQSHSAASSTTARTWNGARSHSTTKSARVDFFYGATRGTSCDRLKQLVNASYEENPLDTIKIAAYLRDCRGGKGERDLARLALRELATLHPKAMGANLCHFVELYGRYDDLLVLLGTPVENDVLELYATQLKQDLERLDKGEDISLCAKWIPSEKPGEHKDFYKKLCKALGVKFANLRKRYLSPLRQQLFLVERYMCAKDWSSINYNTVPSQAMHRYNRAFNNHDENRFQQWISDLHGGKSRVNAKDLFPYELVRRYYNKKVNVDQLVEAQWRVVREEARSIGILSKSLVMADVSGSMMCNNGMPMLQSIALGILVSEIMSGPFHELVLTFDSNPSYHHVTGATLQEKVKCLASAPWGCSTDFYKAFKMILETGIKFKIAQEEMPERLIVISDMQFNFAGRLTNYDLLVKEFKSAGYEVPHLIFWNVNGKAADTPALSTTKGVSLISGCAPSVLKAAVGETKAKVPLKKTPLETMTDAISTERYDVIKIPLENGSALETDQVQLERRSKMLVMFLLGFFAGALLMVLMGWEPLLRGALRITSFKRKRFGLGQSIKDVDWIGFDLLSHDLSEHPLGVADILAYSQKTKEAADDMDTPENVETLDSLSWIEKMFALQVLVKKLLECCVGSEKQMTIVEKALLREDTEQLRHALLELSKPVATILRSTLKVLLYVVENTFSITRREDAQAARATMVDLLAKTFGPSLKLDTKALKCFLSKYENLHEQMAALEMQSTEDALQEFINLSSLQSASISDPSSQSFDTSWVNTITQRLFDEYAHNSQLVAMWEAKANRIIQKQSMPKTIENVELRQLKMGAHAPRISNITVLPTRLPNEVALSMALEYSGGFSFELHTFIPLSDFSRHVTAFSFRVMVAAFSGRVRLFIPMPGKDIGHGWLSFEEIPHFTLHIESCQDPPQKLQQFSKLLTLEIREMIEQNMALPQWTRIELPWHPFASPLDLILPSSRRSTQLSPRVKSFVETAGGIMGTAVGGALGGAFGGKVARAVGEKMGENIAKYATSVLSPVVHDVVQSTKSAAKNEEIPAAKSNASTTGLIESALQKKQSFFSTAKPKSPKKATEKDVSVPVDGIKIDELVALAISRKLMATDKVETGQKPSSPKPTSPRKVDVSKLVAFAKQSKKDN